MSRRDLPKHTYADIVHVLDTGLSTVQKMLPLGKAIANLQSGIMAVECRRDSMIM
jgi:hypothetical protein